MTILKSFLISFCTISLLSCNTNNKNPEKIIVKETISASKKIELSKSQKIINEAITAHGGDLYNTAQYSFGFRNNIYQFKNAGSHYEYTKSSNKDNTVIFDVLKNGNFSRTVNGEAVKLSEKEIVSGTGAINSVIYFATLPYKLNDQAVNFKHIESTVIKNKDYHVIEVTFNKAGGGEDHDDEYYYWINKDTNKIDYLAYNYKVNKGGVRFRSAYNVRVVDGITFQDYINYKADVGTPLKDLPMLYEAEKLKELSTIKTENIINLNKN
ncbi:DUF6503 family protein [Lacinutrix algicola]|uniref:DUF6503 family protein n=1 Tax=Lacinutrix algicola TaxID=342954 RepID=UPI0006E27C5B|nr:DUF6503 family protein [Lacinutrix algicola]